MGVNTYRKRTMKVLTSQEVRQLGRGGTQVFWPERRFWEPYLGGEIEVAFGAFEGGARGLVVNLDSIAEPWSRNVPGFAGASQDGVREVTESLQLPVCSLGVYDEVEDNCNEWISRGDADRLIAALLAAALRRAAGEDLG